MMTMTTTTMMRLQGRTDRHGGRRKNKNRSGSSVILRTAVVLMGCLSFLASHCASSVQDHQHQKPSDFLLTTDSVVLITGAATYLGSELALALQRTYQPKKIILVDDLSSSSSSRQKLQQQQQSSPLPPDDDSLELLDIKRRRLFQILQEGAPGTVHMYRVDLRSPMVEFYDTAQVSVLEHIFLRHADITHIVHLANYQSDSDDNDDYAGSLLGPPREAITSSPKAGLLESLLEHLYQHSNETGRAPPHFTYASSVQVYPRHAATAGSGAVPVVPWTENDAFQPQEQMQITMNEVPSTWYGASRLLDERLAQAYYDMYHLYSVGLRFSTIYGPAADPTTHIHQLAQRAMVAASSSRTSTRSGETNATPYFSLPDMHPNDARDYIYIDDAVDAILSGMQFRPMGGNAGASPAPVVFNVASGETTSIQDVAQHVATALPGTKVLRSNHGTLPRPPIHVSIQSAQAFLGFQPRVSLEQGIQQTLAWHYDQVHPHGLRQVEASASAFSEALVKKGAAGCDPFDKECLRGMPVFPCASECAHKRQCQATFWDSVMKYTQRLTAACPAVLYTVALLPSHDDFLSTNVQVSPDSQQSHFKDSNCNIAFVSADHVEVKRLETPSLHSATRSAKTTGADITFLRRNPLRFGPWTLVPIAIPKSMLTRDLKLLTQLALLPKVSPGRFFQASEMAIYVDPNVIIENLSSLLFQMDMRPSHPDFATMDTRAAMLMGKAKSSWSSRTATTLQQTGVVPEQQAAYRMFHIKSMDFFASSEEDGFGQIVDSSFIAHRLQIQDSQRFRCDVLSEMVQWGDSYDQIAVEDEAAFGFVMGLHDLWSLSVSKSKSHDDKAPPCWWRSAGVQTRPVRIAHRRMEEVAKTMPEIQVLALDEIFDGADQVQGTDKSPKVDVSVRDSIDQANFQATVDETLDVADSGIIEQNTDQDPLVQVSDVHFLGDATTGTDIADENDNNQDTDADDLAEEEDGGESDVYPEQHHLPPSLTYDDEDSDPSMEDVPHYDLVNEFGVDKVSVVIKHEHHDGYSPETEVEDDDGDSNQKEKEGESGSFHVDADPSSYDTWMAVRSSTDVRYFVRLVPADVVGVVRIH